MSRAGQAMKVSAIGVPANLSWALLYAERGWAVLPLHNMVEGYCSCGKSCKSPGKHPRTRNGLKDATTNTIMIRQWWAKNPHANIGIITGALSGLVAVDIDPRHGGDESLASLLNQYGELPETLEAKTGGGGFHFLFQHPGKSFHIKSRANVLGQGLDIRADGGYIVAAPSNHKNGTHYSWSDIEISPATLPSWLLGLISKEKSPQRASDVATDSILEGSRNNTLASLAGSLRQQGKNSHEIKITLLEENQLRCKPPLFDDEVRQVAKSIGGYSNSDRPFKFVWQDYITSEKGPSSATTRHVLLTLSLSMDKDGRSCYPTLEQIAKKACRNRKTVAEHLEIATAANLLHRYTQRHQGQKFWNYGYIAKIPDV